MIGRTRARVPTIFYGAHVRPGTYTEHTSHYGVLRTVEDMYGLPHAGASASASPITDVWR
jgi:phosphatidylinositol-3-phosphatase